MRPRAPCWLRIAALLFLVFCGCARAGRLIAPLDAGPIAFEGVAMPRSHALIFELRGPDFEDARGRGCSVEAYVEEPDAGGSPVLRFRCIVYGGP
jgi:hypothetical protein